jgi:Domain of unknown function (DUF4164)
MAPTRKPGQGTSAAAATRAGRPAARVAIAASPNAPEQNTSQTDAKTQASLVAVTAERNRLRIALKAAQARLTRLEARESVVQDHLTRAIATIDKVLSGS